MAIFTLTVNTPSPTFSSKSSEAAFIRNALQIVEKEFGRGVGGVSSGTIVGQSPAGTPNTALGSWSYTGSATNP